jgi:hypothetical protein
MTHSEVHSCNSAVKAGSAAAQLSAAPRTVVLSPERRQRILRLLALWGPLHRQILLAMLESGVEAIRDGRLQIISPGNDEELVPTILHDWIEAFADGRLDLALVVIPADRDGEFRLRFIPREMKPALLPDLLDEGAGSRDFEELLLAPRVRPRRNQASQPRSRRPRSFKAKARARRAAARRG